MNTRVPDHDSLDDTLEEDTLDEDAGSQLWEAIRFLSEECGIVGSSLEDAPAQKRSPAPVEFGRLRPKVPTARAETTRESPRHGAAISDLPLEVAPW